MPVIEVTAGTPALPAGTYPATLIAVRDKELVTKFSKNNEPDPFYEWFWLVEGEERDVEITSLTSLSTAPMSRIFEYLVAFLGADNVTPGMKFDTDDLIGKKVMLSLIVDPNGFDKVDRVVGAPKGGRREVGQEAKKAAAPAAPVAAEQDDLPF